MTMPTATDWSVLADMFAEQAQQHTMEWPRSQSMAQADFCDLLSKMDDVDRAEVLWAEVAHSAVLCICPVCKGTKWSAPEGPIHSWDRPNEAGELPCENCKPKGNGSYGWPTGMSYLRRDLTPCKHSYTGEGRGRSHSVYKCVHCPSMYSVDSSG